MFTRRSHARFVRALGLVAAVAMLSVGTAQTTAPAAAKLKVGAPAPNFTLKTARGSVHELAKYRGRIVVLEWTDPKCPLVKNQYDSQAMQRAFAEVRKLDPKAVWLAIESGSAVTQQQHDFWIRKHAIKYPILVDGNRAVAKRYGARREPEIFVIDRKGVLRYKGAVDDNRTGDKKAKDVKNYAVNAVRQLVKGEPVKPSSVRAYGCLLNEGRREP